MKDFSDIYIECEAAKKLPERDKKKIWDCIFDAALLSEDNKDDARILTKNLYAHCMSKKEAIEDILEIAENDGKIIGEKKKVSSGSIWANNCVCGCVIWIWRITKSASGERSSG